MNIEQNLDVNSSSANPACLLVQFIEPKRLPSSVHSKPLAMRTAPHVLRYTALGEMSLSLVATELCVRSGLNDVTHNLTKHFL